jgi:hypothetical protein
MKSFLKRTITAIGGVAIAAFLLALAAPKRVQAVVSTLVTVANTTTNPVPTQAVDNPANTPFAASGNCSVQDTSCVISDFFAVPVGMTAVVQDFSGQCRVSPVGLANIPPVNVGFFVDGGPSVGGGIFVAMNPNPGTFGDLSFVTFGRQATMYAVSTANAPAFLTFTDRQNDGNCEISVNGYLVKN